MGYWDSLCILCQREDKPVKNINRNKQASNRIHYNESQGRHIEHGGKGRWYDKPTLSRNASDDMRHSETQRTQQEKQQRSNWQKFQKNDIVIAKIPAVRNGRPFEAKIVKVDKERGEADIRYSDNYVAGSQRLRHIPLSCLQKISKLPKYEVQVQEAEQPRRSQPKVNLGEIKSVKSRKKTDYNMARRLQKQTTLDKFSSSGDFTNVADNMGSTSPRTKKQRSMFRRPPSEMKEEESSAELCGLVNHGNSCFMNSVVQALFHTPDLAKIYDLEGKSEDGNGYAETLLYTLGEMENNSVIKPSALYSALTRTKFRYGDQEDPEECLHYLLDQIYGRINQDGFFVRLESVRTCTGPRCPDPNSDTIADHDVWVLNVPRKKTNLKDMISKFMKTEVVEYVCESCHHPESRISHELKTLGPYFVIQLARYGFSKNAVKNSTDIKIPICMTLNGRDCELYALIVHHGKSTHSGHYTAYVKPQGSSTWYHCDDRSVKAVNITRTQRGHDFTRNSYLLFYKTS